MGVPLDDLMMAAPPVGFKQRLMQALPYMIRGGIAAGASPNTAGGGGADVFRALQAAIGANQEADLLSYNIGRQQREDALRQAEFQRKLHEDELQRRNIESLIREREAESAYRDENLESLREQRKAAAEARQAQAKGTELQRQISLGQAGAEELPTSAPMSQSVGGVNLPMVGKITGPPPKDAYTFTDPFTQRTLAIRRKTGEIEIDPEMAQEIGVRPNAEGKYLVDKSTLARIAGNKTKPEKAPPATLAGLALQAAQGDEEARAAVNIMKPPREPRQPSEASQDRRALQAAKNAALAAAGNDYAKLAADLTSGKYNADPNIGPYVADIQDWATKQAEANRKANETKGVAQGLATRADSTLTAGGRLKKKIEDMQRKYPQFFGQVGGRTMAAGALKFNALPKELRDLTAELHSFFALQPAQHGFRAQRSMESFEKSAGADGSGVFVNPDGVKGGIEGIMQINRDLRAGIKTGRFPDGIDAPPELKGATLGEPAAPQGGEQMVTVIGPKSGKPKQIPASQLQQYLSVGWKQQ